MSVSNIPAQTNLNRVELDQARFEHLRDMATLSASEIQNCCEQLLVLGAPSKGNRPSILNQIFCCNTGSAQLFDSALLAARVVAADPLQIPELVVQLANFVVRNEVVIRLSLDEVTRSPRWEKYGYATSTLLESFEQLLLSLKQLPIDREGTSPFEAIRFAQPLPIIDALQLCSEAKLTAAHPTKLYGQALSGSLAVDASSSKVVNMLRPGHEKLVFDSAGGSIIKIERVGAALSATQMEMYSGQRHFDLTPIRSVFSEPLKEKERGQSREVVVVLTEQPRALLGAPTRWQHRLLTAIRRDGCVPYDIDYHPRYGYLGDQIGIVPSASGSFEPKLLDFSAAFRAREATRAALEIEW